MFSSCLSPSQGPGQGQPQAADILQSYRHWVSPRPQQLWQFSQREAKNDSDLATSQDDTSGVGAMVAGRLEGEPSPKAADSASLEPDPAEAAAAEMGPGSMLESEEPAAQAPVLSLLAASSMGTLDTAMVEKLVMELVPAQQRGDPFIVPTFLCNYRRFTTTQQVLNLLFHRYAYFQPHCEEDDRTKDALCSILGTWLENYPDDFYEFQDLARLKQLVAYVRLHMPFSDLARRAQLLLTELEDAEPKELVAEPEAFGLTEEVLEAPDYPELELESEPLQESGVTPVNSLSAASNVGTLDTAMVQRLVNELVPAQERGDPFIVPNFLRVYRSFATTQQVLHLLFHRYAYFQPHCEEDDRTKDALCSILGTWLENYPDDFYEFQDLARLKQLVAYVRLHMPFSDLARQAQLLLTELEDAEPKELVAEPEAFGLPAVDLEAPRCPEYELESGPAEEPDVTPVNSWSAAHNMGTLDPAMVQRLVNELVPAQERGDPFIVPNFLRVYRSFATTQQVLHLLFHRYGYFQPGCEEDDRAKHALCSILEIWLENYPEDFHGFQDLTCLHQLVAYVRLHMPFSDLAHRAQLLLTELEDAEPKELVAEPEETSLPWAAFLLAPEALESPEYPACELGSGPLQEPDFTPVLSVSAASNVETLDTAMVENLVDELVPALQRGDPFIVPTFLHIYRGFITTQQVLHTLFHRYAYFRSDCEEDNCAKDALCFLLGSWLEKYPEDFSDLACLHQLVAYVQLHMPFSDLACRAQLLLMQLEDTEPTELLAEPEETSLPWAVPLPAALIFEAPEYPAAGPGSGPLQEPDVTSELSLLAASNVETLDTAMVNKLVDELVPALQRGDPFIVPTFLHTYRGFITTQQVLHTLFHRYAYFRSDCEEDDRAKHALCSILGTWLDSFPEDFQDRASLKLLVTYVQLHMPFSDLARQAQLLLIQLEDPEPKEAEAEPEGEEGVAPAPGGDEEVPPAAAAAFLGSDLVPTIALQPEPDEACLSLAIVPAVDSLEPPACPEAKQEPDRPQPWFTKLCWPWGRRRGQCVIPSQDRPRRRSPSWVRTLLSCFPIRSSGPHSGPSHE
ncbi:uncharacterized protein [Oryctolagus cuniculus]|uniref:uncharacterized protein n=1 Tax=Oryctolagus cuniculus TaxID=9986 RepID=UPI00387A73AF